MYNRVQKVRFIPSDLQLFLDKRKCVYQKVKKKKNETQFHEDAR